MHLQENTLFNLDPKVKVTQNVAQYPLRHVTYRAARYEAVSSQGLGDVFTRKKHSYEMLSSTLFIMWSM